METRRAYAPTLAKKAHSLDDVGAPKAQPVAAIRPQDEPAVEQHEVGDARALVRGWADASVVQVEQEQLRGADEDVAGMRVGVQHASVMDSCHESAERFRQCESLARRATEFEPLIERHSADN